MTKHFPHTDHKTPPRHPGTAILPRGNQAYWFSEPVDIIQTDCLEEVVACLDAVEAATQRGYHAVGFVAYEAAPAFDVALTVHPPLKGLPLVWFGIYQAPTVAPWPLTPSPADTSTEINWQPGIERATYQQAIRDIQTHIGKGDTYQVNFTFPLNALAERDPFAWFQLLYKSQPANYSAYLDTGQHQILSLSPELFFSLSGNLLRSKPMKGTRRRGYWVEEDQRLKNELRTSEKEQAENVMIVDMVRNDLGRISDPGTVHVEDLYAIEAYPTVWQMTSQVRCTTRAGLAQIFQALFPPASVTGAPKVETMRIIQTLEHYPRGVYCGAIGHVAPNRDMEFNVAIRTLLHNTQTQQVQYAVGSGITWDSGIDAEYEECLIKAKVLQSHIPEFSLLESLLYDAAGYFLLEEHLKRLEQSATYWGIPFDRTRIRQTLTEFAAQLAGEPRKVRLLLHQDGSFDINQAIAPATTPVRVALAKFPVDRQDVFLYHKTTHRQVYEQFMHAYPGYNDVLLWNADGELTEATTANLVVKLDGQWWTPPVASGLLAGCYRTQLLASGNIREKVLTRASLQHAEAFALINAVRKWIPVAHLDGL